MARHPGSGQPLRLDPDAGFEAKGWPMATIVQGGAVMSDGELIGLAHACPVRFDETVSI